MTTVTETPNNSLILLTKSPVQEGKGYRILITVTLKNDLRCFTSIGQHKITENNFKDQHKNKN